MPARYTCFLQPRGHRFLSVAPAGAPEVRYALSGWLELALEAAPEANPGRYALARIINSGVNIRGALEGRRRPKVPRAVHLSASSSEGLAGLLDLTTGHGRVTGPLGLRYPELAREGHPVTPSAYHQPAVRPVALDVPCAVEYDLKAGGFTVAAAGSSRALPAITSSRAALAMIFPCLCDSKSYCAELCLSIKVAIFGGNPVLSDQDVREVVSKVNAIWACGGTGQCCVRFTIAQIIPVKGIPPSVEIPQQGAGEDLDATLTKARSSICYNVYIVKDTTTGVAGIDNPGATVSDVNPGSLVRVNGLTQQERAETLAHELGHALGLARGKDPIPGVWTATAGTQTTSCTAVARLLRARGSTRTSAARRARARSLP